MGSRATPPTTTGWPYSKHVILPRCQRAVIFEITPLSAMPIVHVWVFLSLSWGGPSSQLSQLGSAVGRGARTTLSAVCPQILLVLTLVIQTASAITREHGTVWCTEMGIGTGGVVDMHR